MVLLIAAFPHSLDVPAVEVLHDGDMRHARLCSSPMPMLLVWRDVDDVAHPDLRDLASPSLHPAGAVRHDQGLAKVGGSARSSGLQA